MNGIEVILIKRECIKAVISEIASECSKHAYCCECPYYVEKDICACIFDSMYPSGWSISSFDKIFPEEKSNGKLTEE